MHDNIKFNQKVWQEQLEWLVSTLLNYPPKGKSDELENNFFALKEMPLTWHEWRSSLEKIVAHTPNTNSGFFVSQLYSSRDPASTIADMLASFLNNSMYTHQVSGVHTRIEHAVRKAFLDLVSWSSQGEAIFCPGGSLSNMVGMMLARNQTKKDLDAQGLTSINKPMIIYTSTEAHYSVTKNAAILGIGKDNIVFIETDAEGKILAKELARRIEQDTKQDKLPFLIHATSGTTVLGAFDDIERLAEIARMHKVWLHVDAAWGGGYLLSEQHRHLLQGIELADSITIDQHKMLGVPLVSSLFLVKHNNLLTKALFADADYLFQDEVDSAYNFGVNSLQCGRRNDALKVWAQWQKFGRKGHADRIIHLHAIADYCVQSINKNYPHFKLAVAKPMLNVCFQINHKGSDLNRHQIAKLCHYLLAQYAIRISMGHWRDKALLRLITTNHSMTHNDIDKLLYMIDEGVNECFS